MEAATGLDLASIIIERAEVLAAGGPKVGLPEPEPLVPPRRRRVPKATGGGE